MRRPLCSLPSLVLGSIALFAAPCLAATVTVATPSACPVALSASHGVGLGVLVPAGPQVLTPPEAPASRIVTQQSFDLSVRNSGSQRIVAAELEVHGTSNKGRMLPLQSADLNTGADAMRKVHLTSSIPADGQRTHTIAVDDLTSVAWISVIELRYADGSAWHAGPGHVCAVTPSPVMLIAAR